MDQSQCAPKRAATVAPARLAAHDQFPAEKHTRLDDLKQSHATITPKHTLLTKRDPTINRTHTVTLTSIYYPCCPLTDPHDADAAEQGRGTRAHDTCTCALVSVSK